jgi:SAM-dependent methyltransferase
MSDDLRHLDLYLRPVFRPWTLDSVVNRRVLLAAIERALPEFHGAVLDVGCGEQPYKSLIMSPPSRATSYLGLDFPPREGARAPDLEWDGIVIPRADESVDSVVLTEVLEHCPDASAVLKEIRRILRPGGFVFFTVPFIWPMHDVPDDEFRYTPFALGRIFKDAGFPLPVIEGTGGRHATLAVMLGLWVRRRPLDSRLRRMTRRVLSFLLWPLIWLLFKLDERPTQFGESTLVVGLCGSAHKP